MDKKYNKFIGLSGLSILIVIGLSCVLFANNHLLSAKEDVKTTDNVPEKIVFPSNPLEKINVVSKNSSEEDSLENRSNIASNITLNNIEPKNLSDELIHEAFIGEAFYLDMQFTLTGDLNGLRGKTFTYNIPDNYFEMLPRGEGNIVINGERVGTISPTVSGDTFFEFTIDSSANLDFGESGVQLNLKPTIRLRQDMAYTSRDKRTEALLVVNDGTELSDGIESLAATEYSFTILPHSPGAFDWLANAEDYGLTPPTLLGASDAYWEEDNYFMGSYFHAMMDIADIKAKNPNFKGNITYDNAQPYYFWGKTAQNGDYYSELVAFCIDVFHTLVAGNGQKTNLEDYVGSEAAAEIHYGFHIGAMLATDYGNNIGTGMQVNPGPITPNKPISFTGSEDTQYNQRKYMYGGQLHAWLVAAQNNLNPDHRLPNLEYSDFVTQSRKNTSTSKTQTDMNGTIAEIEAMIDEFKLFNYLDETPTKMNVGEIKTVFTVPTNQQKFIHYVDYEESKGLDKVTLTGADPSTGVITNQLSVKADTAIAEGDVNIVIRKNTSDFWNNSLGYDALYDASNQKKAVFSMPKAYQPFKTITVFTEAEYNLEIQKTDENGAPLTGAEFDLKAQNGSASPTKTEVANGKVTFTPLVPEVTYELTETKAPDGYQKKAESYTIVMDRNGDLTVKEGNNTLVAGQDYVWDQNNLILSFSVENTPALGDVELVKFDVENISTKLSGAKFDLYKVGTSTPIRNDLLTDADGKLTVSGLEPGDYYFIETQAPAGYDTPEAPDNRFEFTVTAEDVATGVKVEVQAPNVKENTPTGSVQLFKYDSKNENLGLEGAEFSLYKKDGTLLRTELTTDDDGLLVVSDLPFGEYYFVETKAPDGYFLNGSEYPFEITEEHVEVPIEVRVSNVKTPPRELILTKTDEETGKPIPGVVFTIQKLLNLPILGPWQILPVEGTNDEPMYFTTDDNGQIVINEQTEPGLIDYIIRSYNENNIIGMRFREVSTPDGWEDPYPFMAHSNLSDQKNYPLSDIFAVDIPMDNLIGSPLSGDQINVNLTMTNKKEQNEDRSIRVEKRDKDTGNLITNGEATFIIQSLRSDNQWSMFGDYTFTTENGMVTIEDQELIEDLIYYQGSANDQKYRFREIEAPAGYKDPQAPNPLTAKEPQGGIGDEFSKEFVLNEGNSTITVVVENEQQDEPGDRALTLKKEDDITDTPLSGAEFIIEKYDASSETWKQVNSKTYTTNRNGVVELDDDEIKSFGTDYPIYIAFKEVAPPNGYEMPENPYTDTITITATDVTPDYVIKKNHAIPKDREMILKKVDGFTNLPLEGAGFRIYEEDHNGEYSQYNKLRGVYYTNDNGQIIFTEDEISQMDNGNYKLIEVVAPEGYEIPEDPFTEMFTVTDNGVTPNTLTMKNYIQEDFLLKKVDQSGKPVIGAKFYLYKYPGPGASGTPTRYGDETYESDEYGEIDIYQEDLEDLPDGVYFFREYEAPEGYEIDETDTETFTILGNKANPSVIRHVNQYNGRSFEFHKIDDRDGMPYDDGLNGAVFELEKEIRPNTWQVVNDKQGNPITFTTKSYFDDDWELDVPGSIYLNDQDIENYGLENGTYRLRETKAPVGYELPEDPYTKPFVLSASGFSPDYVEKTNSRLSDRELILKKVDGRDQSKGLAGAEFELEYTDRDDDGWYTYNDNQGKPVIFTTNDKGEILLDDATIYDIYHIGEGLNQKGRFKEVKAPEGYLLPDDVYSEEFIIQPTKITDINGRPITEIKKVNYKPVNNYEMELLKVNDNEVRLDGAEFTLVPTDGSGQPQVSTGDKGIFTFKDLEPDIEYTLTETKAPDDYFINKTPYTFILRTDEDPDGILEVYYNGKLLEEGKDYEWNSTQLKLSLVMINRKSSMPITGSIGILSLLIVGATAIGIAYNFQLKKKNTL